MKHEIGLKIAVLALILLSASALFIFGLRPQEVSGLATEEKQPPTYQTRTLKFFIFQEPSVLISPNSTTTQFSIFIGEQSPVIKNAYIEIRGVAMTIEAVTGVLTVTADINQTNSFVTSRKQDFILDSEGSPNHFRILYNGSATQSLTSYLAGIITAPGSYSFYLRVDTNASGGSVSILQARMVITYQFTPPSDGGLPVSAALISPTFDTGVVNGASFNSITWQGALNSGKIRLQLATSNCSNGATNPPTCNSGAWGATGSDYIGSAPSCNNTSYFEQTDTDRPNEIGCPAVHNNKRYFRYKATLCSNDCSTAGGNNPQVNNIIVNWSP